MRDGLIQRGLLTIDIASNAVVGLDPNPQPKDTASGVDVVTSPPVIMAGSRVGLAWTAFSGGSEEESGFRILTMPSR